MDQQNFVFLSFIHPLWSFILIVGLLVFWFFEKKLPSIKSLKRILNIFIVIILFQALLETFLNWWLWSKEKITQRLLPPFTPLTYVLHYSWQHYFFETVVTIAMVLVVFWLIKLLNQRFKNTFFYDEESYLASFGILATGWPNCLIYLSSVLVLGILFHFLFLCFNFNKRRRRGDVVEKTVAQAERAWSPTIGRRSEAELERSDLAGVGHSVFSKQLSEPFRLSLLPFWLPCALLVLLLSGIISKYIGITQLSI